MPYNLLWCDKKSRKELIDDEEKSFNQDICSIDVSTILCVWIEWGTFIDFTIFDCIESVTLNKGKGDNSVEMHWVEMWRNLTRYCKLMNRSFVGNLLLFLSLFFLRKVFLLALCEDNGLYLRALATGTELHSLKGHKSKVIEDTSMQENACLSSVVSYQLMLTSLTPLCKKSNLWWWFI